ncbi:thioredoxin family protein [Brumimicrobium salinarum]|uniref:Thioredoxin family protein n=1 Tax=Brumimicrobium salinarum TaxID=2058658 RepID=A0A2I0R1Q9_9FLAO|nr:thioredoxin family protein [Brumimicrobium salinarum]PKR80502.1 thioredoxin family protein [Brumimicrobium salinarum]
MSNTTTWASYLAKFDEILSQDNPPAPYDEAAFLDYLKLNRSRQKRWLKTANIDIELKKTIEKIDQEQTWYVITEPWCGDAAHSVPFIYKMTQLNPNIDLKIVWRDTEPYMIEDYLTNGGKSVPKVVIRDKNENDLHVWGPRPVECQKLYEELKAKDADFEEQKVALQNWYNKDKGVSIQKEFNGLLQS